MYRYRAIREIEKYGCYLLFMVPLFPYMYLNGYPINLYLFFFLSWALFIYNLDNIKIRKTTLISLSSLCIFLILITWRHLNLDIVDEYEILKSVLILVTNVILITWIAYRRNRRYDNKLIDFHYGLLMLSSVIIWIQFIGSLWGANLVFPWQKIELGISDIWRNRPAGIFGEPAHMGEYALFALAYSKEELYKKKKGLNFLIFSLLMTFSVASWVSAILIFIKIKVLEGFNKRALINIILSLLVIIFFIILLKDFEQFERINLFLKKEGDPSTFERIIAGDVVYGNLNLTEKLLGIGPGDIGIITFRYYNDIRYYNLIINREIRSGLFTELISYGLLFVIFYKLLFLLNLIGLKYLLLILLIQIGSGVTINNPFLGVYIAFVLIFTGLPKIGLSKNCEKNINQKLVEY